MKNLNQPLRMLRTYTRSINGNNAGGVSAKSVKMSVDIFDYHIGNKDFCDNKYSENAKTGKGGK